MTILRLIKQVVNLILHQILITGLQRNVYQLDGRIYNLILGFKGLIKDKKDDLDLWKCCGQYLFTTLLPSQPVYYWIMFALSP